MLQVGRLVRFLIFAAGTVVGYAVAQFVNGNRQTIAVSMWPYEFRIPVYLLALVPLGIGLAAGYLYTAPARAQEFAEHWRSWRALRRMEKENSSLRRSLDKVLDLPDDEPAPALPRLEAPAAAEAVAVHDGEHVEAPPAAPASKGLRAARKAPAAGATRGAGRTRRQAPAAPATAS